MAFRDAEERMRTMWPLILLMCALFVYMSGVFLIFPLYIDVLLYAFCPGQNECSEVIYLTGIQTVVSGVGAMLVAPILGGLSDDYGRKPVFLLVLASGIVPSLILAYSRETVYVYVWWALNLFGHTLREAGLLTITFAYVADIVPDARQRAPAIGITMSSISIGLLAGTVVARVLSITQSLRVAALLQIAAAVLVKVFLIESHPKHSILLSASAQEDDTEKLVPLVSKPNFAKSIFADTLEAVRSSKMLRTVAGVAFMVSFAETAVQATLLLYLRAVFGFNKDDFAQYLIVLGVVSIIAQMVVLPLLAHGIGERGVLWVGLVGGAAGFFLYAFAFAAWVPYLACVSGIFNSLIPPAIGTIVSRGAEVEDQGRVQGLIASVKTLATVIGPLAVTPLTAAFLSENPPFKCPGITLIVAATSLIVGLLISLTLPSLPTPSASFETVMPSTDEPIVVTTSEAVEAEGRK